MKFRTAFATALLVAAATIARADAEPTAAGLWAATDDDGFTTAWFLFSEKAEVYSARLVKGFKKPGDETVIKNICSECPGKKKGARIMGLTLFYGMKRDGLTYTDGSVLDPRDGSVYHAKMYLSEDGKELKVRGYIGIEIMGKTQTWKRLPDDAMKKEDVPREVLAGDDASLDKKAHGDVADKGKHKPKKPQPDKPEAAATDGGDADKPAQ